MKPRDRANADLTVTPTLSDVAPRVRPVEVMLDGATMVHEVRNILTLVRGWVELGRTGDPALAARAWPVIEDGIARATSLLERGARDSSTQHAFDLGEVAQRVADLIEASCLSRGITLRREITAIEAIGDAEMSAQIALNFALNAVQAMTPPGGTLTLTTGGTAEQATLKVIDDGPGMTDEVLGQIFDPFFSTRATNDGTIRGIGLAVSRGLAETMGGRVHAESALGAGSTMTLTLRAARRPRVFSEVPLSEVALRPGLRVLVLDDERAIRELLEVALTLRGVRVHCCEDHEAARRAALLGEYDIALVDESLGEGGSGSEFLAELGRSAPTLGRVLMTGAADASGLTAVANARLVRKPFLLEEVLRALAESDPRCAP